jgi:putative FmdB family regulatory protein
MPLFEYQCLTCGQRFEALVVANRRPESCPRCASPEIEKQASTFGMGGGTGGYAPERSWGSSCGSSGGT